MDVIVAEPVIGGNYEPDLQVEDSKLIPRELPVVIEKPLAVSNDCSKNESEKPSAVSNDCCENENEKPPTVSNDCSENENEKPPAVSNDCCENENEKPPAVSNDCSENVTNNFTENLAIGPDERSVQPNNVNNLPSDYYDPHSSLF
jgi:hypothetical protein